MTKKILSVLLAVMMIVSVCTFTVSADEVVYYVEEGAAGDGSEDDPFGSLQEAILALDGKDGTIMVYGAYNIGTFKQAAWEGMVTVKGINADSIITLPKSAGIEFAGDITFKDIAFDIGQNAHFNPNNAKLIMDGGEKSEFKSFIHLGMLGSKVVEEGYAEWNSGKVSRLDFGGAYCTSLANGVMGDHVLIVNGGEVESVRFSADKYMDTHTGISVGGNMNLIVNGGTIGSILCEAKTSPEVMGAVNIIFNNGTQAPEKFASPETVSAGTFIIKSAEGGMIMPTVDAGVFEVKANKGKIAVINGEQVLNGTVTLEAGETEVTWVDGEQAEEKTEIKLVIGKAEIVTNGEAKALDVPAQIIDSRTMVPLRAIFEALGASVEWDDATKTVTSKKDATTVKLTIGTPAINVNGADKALDVAAQIVESRTMVPARAVAEAYGCEVAWDDATKTVTITK